MNEETGGGTSGNQSGGLGRRLLEVAWGFLPLGWVAFGGPQAHIALLQDHFVFRRKWLDIQATSSLGNEYVLKATYWFGSEPWLPESTPEMEYSGKKDKWSIRYSSVSPKPASVRVCSSSGVCTTTDSIGGR